MKKVNYEKLDKEISVGDIIYHKASRQNGLVTDLTPLTIECAECRFPVTKESLLFYIYEDKDIEEINERTKELKNFFNKG